MSRPRAPVRGVIEGFYGNPWSWQQRGRMVDFMAAHGYNAYIYAPKNDRIHRDRWREPYLPEELHAFDELARRCRERGIEFVFGISPLRYRYSDAGEFDVLWRKVVACRELGVRSFCLLVDDMPQRFASEQDARRHGSMAAAHAWLANTLLERLRDLGGSQWLVFTPTDYHGDPTSAYLSELGAALDPAVSVFWTGREIRSATLKAADARTVSATLRRPVLYWDNYPVNDLDRQCDPHLRPVTGREAALIDVAEGVVANASLQPEASTVALHTYAQFFADPARYEPEAAWRRALAEVTGDPHDAEAVAVLGDLSRRSPLEPGRELDDATGPLLERFWRRWETPSERREALAEVSAELARLRQAAEILLGTMANPWLQAELRPWSTKLARWISAAEAAVAVLEAVVEDPEDDRLADLRAETLACATAARDVSYWVAGDRFDRFSRDCLWAATALAVPPRRDA